MHDGGNHYGFTEEQEIGTRSIRSGAAMALAPQGGQSDPNIMILGRWKSRRFKRYIRLQALEWAGSMSSNMVKAQPFFGLGEHTNHSPTPRPSPRAKKSQSPCTGRRLLLAVYGKGSGQGGGCASLQSWPSLISPLQMCLQLR